VDVQVNSSFVTRLDRAAGPDLWVDQENAVCQEVIWRATADEDGHKLSKVLCRWRRDGSQKRT